MSKPLEYDLHDVKDGKIVVQTFSFGNWHRGEIEKGIKDAGRGSVLACVWEFMKDIKIDEQYLQYMASHGKAPKEWVGQLPKMILTDKGYLIKEKDNGKDQKSG